MSAVFPLEHAMPWRGRTLADQSLWGGRSNFSIVAFDVDRSCRTSSHGPTFTSKFLPKPTHLPASRVAVSSDSSWIAPKYRAPL
ncbi:hypothetical protein [Nocardia sp. MDA0666]|uniref:hypothetical protein n=1 Tax=Nocardia sp. MDA0666 TaxID=2135448 RepID=UPI0018ECD86C|nr:hypothetical protein [Nocardia sp. MDA0666]